MKSSEVRVTPRDGYKKAASLFQSHRQSGGTTWRWRRNNLPDETRHISRNRNWVSLFYFCSYFVPGEVVKSAQYRHLGTDDDIDNDNDDDSTRTKDLINWMKEKRSPERKKGNMKRCISGSDLANLFSKQVPQNAACCTKRFISITRHLDHLDES